MKISFLEERPTFFVRTKKVGKENRPPLLVSPVSFIVFALSGFDSPSWLNKTWLAIHGSLLSLIFQKTSKLIHQHMGIVSSQLEQL